MSPDYGLSLVRDPDDTLDARDYLRSLHRPDAGVVVVEPTAAARTTHWLATEILAAVGKDEERSGAGRDARRSWRHVLTTLTGLETTDLVINRAQELDRHRWEWLFELAAACGLRLWFVVQVRKLRRLLRETANDWPIRVLDFGDFRHLWSERAEDAGTPSRPALRMDGDAADVNLELPKLPGDDFTTFPAACQQQLNTVELECVERIFSEARLEVRDWFTENPNPSESELADELRRLLRSSRTTRARLVQLRAAQWAALEAGYLVKVNTTVFADSADEEGPGLDAAAARTLVSYAESRYAAAAGAALAVPGGLAALIRLTIDAVDLEAACFVTPEGEWCFAQEARPLFAAHLAQRRLEGARAGDPLFVSGMREVIRPATRRSLQLTLRTVANETGLHVATDASSGKRSAKNLHWMRRHGVSIQRLVRG